MCDYIDDEMELITGAPRRGHVTVLRALDLRPPKKEELTETRHLRSRLGCLES